jgi:hypothetical protein
VSKSILVTTDFSASGRSAIDLALGLCREMHCDLILLHTYRLINNRSEDVVAWKRRIEREAREQFSLIEDSTLRTSFIKYTLKIEVGFLVDRVGDIVRKNDVVLFVTDKVMYIRSNAVMDELVESINVPIVIAPILPSS